jgi:hypothetical protein
MAATAGGFAALSGTAAAAPATDASQSAEALRERSAHSVPAPTSARCRPANSTP